MTKIALFEGYGDVAKSPSGIDNAPVMISKTFNYQSYFDTTKLSGAVNGHAPGQLIVPSTMKAEQIYGFAVGLHPSSDTPVAIQFKSQTYLLKPGQVIKPYGNKKPFESFKWGLPFGWLGGGTATLMVFPSPEAEISWDGRPEIIFHRQTLVLGASSDDAPAAAPWPTRFPSASVFRHNGAASVRQAGLPSMCVEPTRTLLRLRKDGEALATPYSMRCYFKGIEAFDCDGEGGIAENVSFVDLSWPSFNELSATGTFPVLEFTSGPLVRFGSESFGNGVYFVAHPDGDAVIGNLFVDVLRYGRL